ncbi:putative nucleic acid-binding protein, contains PIN domain [Rivularia sp. PCC 7116]|uniref:type II toxin-antitoxin system VapC family toxin n=1 Tax=Rivularia sp. PCC 7116 TaxID=373994 RepID=UPI00029EDC66|nr:type II toxin-antitoxin system VapC family toxin [Rivularia sp. PCC 7116]AFY58844.1 putative nucleic acid-binding protein, contains PIN domain [Rivularia sp. PCC 7116]
MKYLLDTCVIYELVAKKPSKKVIDWIDNIEQENIYLSVITIGEIRKGIEKLPESKRKTNLQQWLNDELLIRFQGKILVIDTDVILVWGELTGRLDIEGKRMPAIDSLIAAIAIHNNCSLVTRNEYDFKDVGLSIVNPWQ